MKTPAEHLPLDLEPLGRITVEAIYDRADQALLQTLREDRRVERKPPNVPVSRWCSRTRAALMTYRLFSATDKRGCSVRSSVLSGSVG